MTLTLNFFGSFQTTQNQLLTIKTLKDMKNNACHFSRMIHFMKTLNWLLIFLFSISTWAVLKTFKELSKMGIQATNAVLKIKPIHKAARMKSSELGQESLQEIQTVSKEISRQVLNSVGNVQLPEKKKQEKPSQNLSDKINNKLEEESL